ncbi:phage major capsid protein, P2 family [Psychromonas hadalis]|uniref:phage major capsid protein, P2 family n=1 Tax=Psychromonas hadalis TaxID=211669 RepID=UPI0003B3B6A4|nr:phage major capsid protein, P2 family [Psychromonas hadalis]
MENFTRKQVSALELAVAKQFGAENVSQTFSITPQKAQKIIAAARLENSFLGRINVIMVSNQQGEALALDATGMIAGTTDTSSEDRIPKDPHSKGGTSYHCQQINFDTLIKYVTLDAWAHNKKFKSLVAVQTRKQISTNQIQIGFYGKSRAATSNPVNNPKGQDIAIGWLEKLRTQNAENWLDEGETAGEIRIGEKGDYINLDAAVNDTKQMIDPVYEDDGDLVAIIGSELLAAEKAKFYDLHGNTPSEKSKIEDRQIIGTYGGLPAFKIPHFPSRGILVTSFKNLSIYIQKDSVRRRMEDNAKRDRYETYQSQNMDYVIEELGKAAALNFENVKLSTDGGTNWA